MNNLKQCRQCNEYKTMDRFYFRKKKNYYENTCNDCKNQRSREKNALLHPKSIIPNGMKRCCKCKELKELKYFGKNKNSKDGLKHDCKICRNAEKKKYRENNKDKIRKYEKQHLKERMSSPSYKNKKKRYYIKHKEERLAYHKEWFKKNKQKVNKQYKIKRETDSAYKLATNIRTRLNRAIKTNQKAGSAIRDLGCSIGELKHHLESKFYSNSETGEMMSWKNYGIHGWHVDHIIPLSKFNLTNRNEFLKACHYTNLQPMWAKENIRKSNKIV